MTILSRMLQLRGLVQSIEHKSTVLYPPNWTRTPAGENPDDIEGDGTIVYGDNVVQLFPEIDTPCARSPSGQCEFNALAPDHERCIHCKRRLP